MSRGVTRKFFENEEWAVANGRMGYYATVRKIPASIAQRIELLRPKEKMVVQFRLGAMLRIHRNDGSFVLVIYLR